VSLTIERQRVLLKLDEVRAGLERAVWEIEKRVEEADGAACVGDLGVSRPKGAEETEPVKANALSGEHDMANTTQYSR
jgi:hypothetical protein